MGEGGGIIGVGGVWGGPGKYVFSAGENKNDEASVRHAIDIIYEMRRVFQRLELILTPAIRAVIMSTQFR